MVILNDLDAVLKGFDGVILKDGQGKEMTVRKVLVAELGGYAGQKVGGDALIKAYELGSKIHLAEGGSTELDTDQISFIKTVMSENPLYLAIVMGQVLKYIEEAKAEASLKEKAAKEEKASKAVGGDGSKKEAGKPLTD